MKFKTQEEIEALSPYKLVKYALKLYKYYNKQPNTRINTHDYWVGITASFEDESIVGVNVCLGGSVLHSLGLTMKKAEGNVAYTHIRTIVQALDGFKDSVPSYLNELNINYPEELREEAEHNIIQIGIKSTKEDIKEAFTILDKRLELLKKYKNQIH